MNLGIDGESLSQGDVKGDNHPLLVVEFAGAPGSGKSTIRKKVAEDLNRRTRIPVQMHTMDRILDIKVVKRRRGLARIWPFAKMVIYTLKSMLLGPTILAHFLRVKRHDEKFTMADLILQVQIHYSRFSRIRRLEGKLGIHLLDSGVVTSHCAMEMYGEAHWTVSAFRRSTPPYFVVRLKVEEEELRRRIMTRPHNPRARHVHSRNPLLLQRFVRALDDFEHKLEDTRFSGCLIGVMDVENGEYEALDENAELVSRYLEELWNKIICRISLS